MAKKSQKRHIRHERDQAGCMWGLFKMFDFRRGRSTQKLLSDRRRGTRHVAARDAINKPEMLIHLVENCQGKVGGEESTITAAGACKPSVKKLMEDEMFYEKNSEKELNNVEVELNKTNSEYGGRKRKNCRRTSRSRTKSCEINIADLDTADNLDPEKPCPQRSEKQYADDLHMDDMVEEFCSKIPGIRCSKHDQHGDIHHQPNKKSPEFEEKLREAFELFVRQRLINEKHGKLHDDVHLSNELKNALKILSSDEELFQKFLQGSKSVMVKYLENLWIAQVEKDEVSKPLVESNSSEQEIHVLEQIDEGSHSKKRKFLRRKSKSQEFLPSKGGKDSQASNRIIILKPGPTGLAKPGTEGSLGPSSGSKPLVANKGPDERAGYYFFFSEIKRKLKQAIGKEQGEIARDGISRINPNKHQTKGGADKKHKEKAGRISPNKDHFFIEKIAKPASGVKKGEKTEKSKECKINLEHETVNPKQRLSNIYVEAKKHLSEMLTSGNRDVDKSSRQVPKRLGRILSLPEYNVSPLGSPGRDWSQSFVTAQMISSASDRSQKQENKISPLGRTTINLEPELCVSDESLYNKAEAFLDPNSVAPNEVVQDIEVENILKTSEGDAEIVKTNEIVIQDNIDVLNSLPEPCNSSMIRDDQNIASFEVPDAKGCSECLKPDSSEEIQHLPSVFASPSLPSITKKDDDLQDSVEVLDRPSPVSVLEPLLIEEDINPASTRSQPAKLTMQPLRIQFEEHDNSAADLGNHLKACIPDKESVFDYIKAVLEASELNWDEFYIMSSSSDPLLDPSIYDEVDFSPNHLCYDKQLLFDCIDEVLMEVYEQYFGCPLGLSFGKPTIRPSPDMKNAIHEVWEGVYWYLLPLPKPGTLEQIVKKDVTKIGSWMSLRCDGEAMVIEIGESIFKDLIEETVLTCVNDNVDGGSRRSIPL